MANAEQVAILKDKGKKWTEWRQENPDVAPDLSEANLAATDLSGTDLSGTDLSGANLWGADLSRAKLSRANLRGTYLSYANLSEADLSEANVAATHLSGADLSRAKLWGANLSGANLSGANLAATHLSGADLSYASLRGADLSGANLSEADLSDANLSGANLSEADLSGADLSGASLISSDLESADLTGAKVYGISAWDVNLQHAIQKSLVITPSGQPEITLDNLEVAQFIYLLLNNAKIRDVIDTITSKAVLILGCFTPERKPTLEALRDALRHHNYLPILFDFEKPANRDFTETVSTLAHLARFVIADLTDPRSIPQELTAVIRDILSVPVQPLLLGSQSEWTVFSDLARYPQVIPPFYYADDRMLLSCLEEDVIVPAEQKAREIAGK
jgi:uncharacterized protein YjbI with pentapeptide repeats